MDLYPGAKAVIKYEQYEVLQVNWTYGTVTCKDSSGKIKDFNLDELEE